MDTGILDTMLATIAGYTTGSSGTITGYATSLYGILILLDFILAVLLNIGETDHIKQLVRKVLFYGFWIWIIREWGTLCDALLDSLMITGTAVGGVDASVLKAPSLLIDRGIEIGKPYLTYASEMSWLEITASPLNWLMAIIGYAGVVLAFAILALQIFITYVEFYIASALLLIFIPWGSFKYTSFVAEKAIGAVISYGTKLMMLGAVYGLSAGIIDSMSISLNGEPEPGSVLASMLGPFALCLLCWQAPGMAAGLMTGAPTLSAGTAAGTAVAGFAGAAAGGSAGAGIGSMAMSTGSSAARAGAALAGAATAGSTAGGPGAGGAAGAMSGAAGFAASAFKSAASNATQGVRGAFASGQASVAASGGSSSGSSVGGSVSGSGGAGGSAAGSSGASTSASGSGSTGSSAASAAQSMGAGSSAGAGSSTGGASGSAQTASAFASNASGSTKSAAAQGNTSTNAFSTAGNSSAGGSSAKTASSFAAGEASGGSTSSHTSASAAFQKAIDETKQAVPPEASPQGGFSVPLPKDND
mgnify:CR=1 FL=1